MCYRLYCLIRVLQTTFFINLCYSHGKWINAIPVPLHVIPKALASATFIITQDSNFYELLNLNHCHMARHNASINNSFNSLSFDSFGKPNCV